MIIDNKTYVRKKTNDSLSTEMKGEIMARYCKICGSEIPDDFPTDICYDCQSIMSQGNLFN
jgi:hypothetical protein